MSDSGSASEDITELRKYALSPFRDQRGDIILQSSDRVHYRVLKSILGLASSVVDDMFSLPQAIVKDEKPHETAVVSLSESSDTVDAILRFCYLVARSQLSQRRAERFSYLLMLSDNSDACSIFFECMLQLHLTSKLFIHTINHEDRSSMHYTCNPPARPLKARFLKTIFIPSSHQSFTFDLLPGLNRVMSPDPIVNGPNWSILETPVNSVSPRLSPILLRSSTPPLDSPIELASSPFDGTRHDVILQSVDRVNFRVLKSIMELASPFFADMFSLPQPPAKDGNPGEIPVVRLAETSTTLDALLRFCYPVKRPRLDQQDVLMIAEVLRAALKYDIDAVIDAAKEAFEKRVNVSGTEAIKGYAIACSMHRYEEARIAATASLRWPSLDIRIPQLALMTGLDHYDFLNFRKRVGTAVDVLNHRQGFFSDTCPELINPSCCYGRRKDHWVPAWRSGLEMALKEAPLDFDKVTLSIISNALFQACSNCKDRMTLHWDDARSKIKEVIRAKVGEVELKQQHNVILFDKGVDDQACAQWKQASAVPQFITQYQSQPEGLALKIVSKPSYSKVRAREPTELKKLTHATRNSV
ncbi:hypothetical protein ACEPAG_3045 [Sanghuangporus baumii]